MDPYVQAVGHRAAEARREKLLNAICDYRHLAAARLAMDDAHERAVAEAARSRLLATDGVAAGWRPFIGAMRRRVGAALVGVGTRLQGTAPTGHASAAPAGGSAAA